MLFNIEEVPLRPNIWPGFRPEVTLMSRALSCSPELDFFDIPALFIKGEDDTVRLIESGPEVLWPFLGDDVVFGVSPDLGDRLKFSELLACSLFMKPRPLLKAQWK